MPRCTLILTGAPLAGRAPEFVQALQHVGFDVDYLISDAAANWARGSELHALGVQSRASASGAPRAPLPELVVVCPATFNTINKLAAGIADTRLHSFLAECLATRTKTLLVPMINDRLWNHPALQRNLEGLAAAGCITVDVRTLEEPAAAVASGTGEIVVSTFDVNGLAELAKSLLA